ncbi:MAG: hypothetical protein KJ015_33825 [Myxococcales bacterium]|nr:hypothetical protein [Myxococcales bacterium]
MAKVCVQCDKKIGMFSSAIEGVYCSYECRDQSRKAIAENERRSQDRIVEAEKAARDAAAAAAAAEAAASAAAARLRACPKCGAEWRFVHDGAGAGLHRGECGKCGLAATFKDIEKCPTCTGMSLLVEATGSRCPRCKFRRA